MPSILDLYHFYGGPETGRYGPATDGSVARLQPNYGQRYGGHDGMKSQGWLGPMMNGQGQSVTEYSVGFDVNGKPVEMPSIVPGLSPEELRAVMLSTETGASLPEAVVQKAYGHGMQRIQQGKSPFWNPGD